MMFLAMLIVIIIIILFIVGIITFFLSILFTILFATLGKKNKVCRILKIICPFVCIGSILLMIPFGLFAGYFLKQFTSVPEEYVKCDTKIKLVNGFNQFKINDEEYIILGYELNYHSSSNRDWVPVYSYCPSGFLNRYQWRNVYQINTSQPFSLYSMSFNSEGYHYGVYAKKEERETIISYYNANKDWIYSYNESKASKEIVDLIEKYEASTTATEIHFPDNYASYKFEALSLDEQLVVDDCTVFVMDNKVYISTYTFYDNYFHYYGYEIFDEEKQRIEQEINFL